MCSQFSIVIQNLKRSRLILLTIWTFISDHKSNCFDTANLHPGGFYSISRHCLSCIICTKVGDSPACVGTPTTRAAHAHGPTQRTTEDEEPTLNFRFPSEFPFFFPNPVPLPPPYITILAKFSESFW